jgi:CBS domain-containing protein
MPDRAIATRLRARDLMQTDVLTVSPETSILDVHRMFVEEEIHGAPVVDDSGVVRGVVSTLDLLRIVSDDGEPDARGLPYFRAQPWAIPNELANKLAEVTASDVMTRELVAVSPDTPIAEVAQKMRDQHVHRVLVLEKRELLGVLTTFDLLRAFVVAEPKPTRRTLPVLDSDRSG